MTSNFRQWRAFSVHLLTASGAFWAFMSIIAAADQHWVHMFAWLGLALFVDGIDGPLARRADVKTVLPNWSGDMLDAIIDYSTYVLIPAFALYQSGMIGRPWSFVAAGLIVITSAVYYADMRMKTKDNFFRGFPVTWNMVVFTLFATRPNEWTAFLFVAFCSAATFLPIKFLHPVRVSRWRPLNLAIFAVWSVCSIIALLANFEPAPWVRTAILVSGVYLFSIGGILQLADRIRGRGPISEPKGH
ncbi:phosphatidylcholine synthase [Aureimonas pseudogalii]|uniref:Phosphatidylcholine synthase n=1 Tax=Aureimonas pseudogalii TaxID=1744844 RepID=A0A7W6MMA0_9HYPH|nr:phosphatidylcholine/phosphatidylserine synthase [Aureimonas pseudogalii]MBB4000574.1 phosphatidylcholine synthase [Aureimonas pseudogalii]